MAHIPAVLILDDGELDDVQGILEELQVEFGRVRGGAIAPNTPPPKSLLMATPRRISAVSTIDEAAAGEDPPVRVVVVDQDSRTLREQLRRVGFDYLVRRPVHPEALRLLVMHSLYRGEEKRREPRVAVGLEISFQTGEIPRRATLVDLSTGGCRLISSFELEAGKKILITLPETLGATEAITLEGTILRSSYDKRIGEEGMHTAAVRFESLSSELRDELEWIIEDKVGGPPTMGADPQHPGAAAADPSAPHDKPASAVESGGAPRPLARRTLLEKETVAQRADPRSEGSASATAARPTPERPDGEFRFPFSVPVDVKMARAPQPGPAAVADTAAQQATPKTATRPLAAGSSAPARTVRPPGGDSRARSGGDAAHGPGSDEAARGPVGAAVQPPAAGGTSHEPVPEIARDVEAPRPSASPEERRAAPRHPYAAKIPAFGSRALRVLVGRDLSVGGMRIESNPDLEVGDRLHLAIYGDASEEPFLIWGTIVRGDGRGGTAVAFDPVHPKIAQQLEALIASLPAVESLHDDEVGAMGTVLTEIINE